MEFTTGRKMRILVATTSTIPAYSGGWTTPLDLFGDEHQAMYVVRDLDRGSRTIEGVKCVGVRGTRIIPEQLPCSGRIENALLHRLFSRSIEKHFKQFRADFVLCLDYLAGYAAKDTGIPYAMRFHSNPGQETETLKFKELVSKALFATACPFTYIPKIEVIPHNQDLSRFIYNESDSAERAVLLTTINDFREPDIFIDGIMMSKKMEGDIVGTGTDTDIKRIKDLCANTNGRVRCIDPVPRLMIPELLRNYQVGVAIIKKVVPVHYQMKVNAYMASGLFTLVNPWTHIAVEAPTFVGQFSTVKELAVHFDNLSENWLETLEIRREALKWILESYSVEIPRKRFREILDEINKRE